MIRSRSLPIAGGALALSLGLLVRLWAPQGNIAHFISGFLLGVSVALLILGLAQPKSRVPR